MSQLHITLEKNSSVLNKLQEEHLVWQKENFGYTSSEDYLLGVAEEVGELCHAFLKRKQRIRNNEPHEENIYDSIGDIIIFLSGFCNNMNISLEDTIIKTWDKVKQRNWNKNRINGIDTNELKKI